MFRVIDRKTRKEIYHDENMRNIANFLYVSISTAREHYRDRDTKRFGAYDWRIIDDNDKRIDI